MSLKTRLEQPDRAWKTAAFSQYPRKTGKKHLMVYTMRTARHRYTKWEDRRDHTKGDAVELHNHQTDPQENTNIATEPARAGLLYQFDAQWLAGEWNIEKTRIGASGGSAGACSSLWLTLHDDMAQPGSADPIARESTRLACAGVVGAQTSLDPG